MNIYADTSFLVSLYVQDTLSARAQTWLSAHPATLPLTAFTRVELQNAIARLVFRGMLEPRHQAAAWQLVETDVQSGRLIPTPLSWPDALAEAERLTAQHTARLGTRTLDILHIACARQIGATEFLSFDDRQGGLAKAAGLIWHSL